MLALSLFLSLSLPLSLSLSLHTNSEESKCHSTNILIKTTILQTLLQLPDVVVD